MSCRASKMDNHVLPKKPTLAYSLSQQPAKSAQPPTMGLSDDQIS